MNASLLDKMEIVKKKKKKSKLHVKSYTFESIIKYILYNFKSEKLYPVIS